MDSKKPRKLIAVIGPTASGKTGLAVFLAKKFDGEIVSADSRQVYKGLDIGTGKEGQPAQDAGISKSKFLISNKISKSKNENCKLGIENLKHCQRFIDNIPQWLIDIVEPEAPFTLFDWLDKAQIVIDDIFSRGKLPIIVGGTGLYTQALVEGFALRKTERPEGCHCEESATKQSISDRLPRSAKPPLAMTEFKREELDRMSLSELKSLLKKLEAKSCKLEALDMKNPRRLIRFIERAQSGEKMTKIKPDFEVLQIGTDLPRDVLYQNIDLRVDQWFAEGFLGEVKVLLNRGIDINWLNKIGLEYKILANYIKYQELVEKNENSKIEKLIENCKLKIENLSSLESVKQAMKYAIHGYARRQLTWFRRFPEIKWVKSKEDALELAKEFVV